MIVIIIGWIFKALIGVLGLAVPIAIFNEVRKAWGRVREEGLSNYVKSKKVDLLRFIALCATFVFVLLLVFWLQRGYFQDAYNLAKELGCTAFLECPKPNTEYVSLENAKHCMATKCTRGVSACVDAFRAAFPQSPSIDVLEMLAQVRERECAPKATEFSCVDDRDFESAKQNGAIGLLEYQRKCRDNITSFTTIAKKELMDAEDREYQLANECLGRNACIADICLDKYHTDFEPNHYSEDLIKYARDQIKSGQCFLSREIEDYMVRRGGICRLDPSLPSISYRPIGLGLKHIVLDGLDSSFFYTRDLGNAEKSEDCSISFMEDMSHPERRELILGTVGLLISGRGAVFNSSGSFRYDVANAQQGQPDLHLKVTMIGDCTYELQQSGLPEGDGADGYDDHIEIWDLSKMKSFEIKEKNKDNSYFVSISGDPDLSCTIADYHNLLRGKSSIYKQPKCVAHAVVVISNLPVAQWKSAFSTIHTSICARRK